MRVLTWGIVVLFGLALGLSAMRVHGSRDERAAIRLAMRAPFADLRRRDAQRLCDDFTPAVDARLAPGTGGCDTQVGAALRLARNAAVYLAAPEPAPPERSSVLRISWKGDRATAASSFARGGANGERRWLLQRVGHRWRIATPMRLDVRADCPHRASGERACPYMISMGFVPAAVG
jgi:hypothetical protein